ncbi:helix-turn-helix transcriptional regulator [Sphingomonas adhaesiva]|uniref:helix-turn-helix transcriptional regulator n=1 Tax=Sphingomonas adhaesiva TaxID=28212 RepID=UPI002FF738EE
MRPLDAAAPIADAGEDPLSVMMREIVREFAADGVLISQREEGADPVVLFAEGDVRPARMQMDALLIESDAGAGRPGSGGAEWIALADDPAAAILTTSIPARDGVITVRTVFARISDASRGRARLVSARLAPLLKPFASLWWQHRRAQTQVRALTHAIDRADIGVLLVDPRGEVTFANAAARALVAAGDGVRMRGAMLGGATLADTLRLHAAVEHVISAGAPDAAAPVVALPRASRRPLMAAVVAGEAPDAREDATAAIIYLVDPEDETGTLIAPACKLYGLSPVETRLTCLLAEGMSLADAAQAMRVREMTARSYLKQIFLKTETNRQAELVWLMLKSVVRTRSARDVGTMVATLV